MTDQGRVAAGVPTGGQFAGRTHSDDGIVLTNRMQELVQLEQGVRREKALVATQMIADVVRLAIPDARRLLLEVDHGGDGHHYPSKVVTADGSEVLIDGLDSLDHEDLGVLILHFPEHQPVDQLLRPTQQPDWEWIEWDDGDLWIDLDVSNIPTRTELIAKDTNR